MTVLECLSGSSGSIIRSFVTKLVRIDPLVQQSLAAQSQQINEIIALFQFCPICVHTPARKTVMFGRQNALKSSKQGKTDRYFRFVQEASTC